MLHITIDKPYSFPENWSEITLSKAGQLFEIPIPLNLKDCYKTILEGKESKELSNNELSKEFPIYYGNVLALLGNIPIDIINKVTAKDRIIFYNKYCIDFVIGVHFSPNYTLQGIESFKLGDETLYLPKSKDVLGNVLPMAYTTAFEFTETADLELLSHELAQGKYEVMANIISILCRPLNEVYDEDVSLERAAKMKDLSMDICWEVFFCFIKLLRMQEKRDQMYLQERLMQSIKLPLSHRAWVRGTILLSKWGKRFRGLMK